MTQVVVHLRLQGWDLSYALAVDPDRRCFTCLLRRGLREGVLAGRAAASAAGCLPRLDLLLLLQVRQLPPSLATGRTVALVWV